MNALLWDRCFSMHKSLLYQQPTAPVNQTKLDFILLCIYHCSERTQLKRNCESFQQVWGGFRCCEPSVSSCFFFLNLNGVCRAESGPGLGIIPFGMILRMEMKMNCCWKVLWNGGAGCARVHACTSVW